MLEKSHQPVPGYVRKMQRFHTGVSIDRGE
jgi:hypothetical protein